MKPPPAVVLTVVEPVGPLTVTLVLPGKYEPLTAIVLPGLYVVLSSEIWACGLQANAMATGTTKAATSIVAKVTWRLRPAPVRPDFGDTALLLC